MAKTVVGLFDNTSQAQSVVQDLVDNGFSRNDISVVAQNRTNATGTDQTTGDSEAAEGAGVGAAGGAVLGGVLGLLVGIGALAIPGIGPVLAAGPLAAAIGTTSAAVGSAAVGAGIGAATGGLLGALVGAGVPEEDAHVYAEGLRRGGTLVMVQASDDVIDSARAIMRNHGVVNIDERGTQWRQSGWNGFNSDAEPYTNDESFGDKWQESSKVGTAGGTVAGAVTGAAIGAVGGPVGSVIGGVAGAAAGAGVGAAGDAAGETADDATSGDADYNTDRSNRSAYGNTMSDVNDTARGVTQDRDSALDNTQRTASNTQHTADNALGNLDEKWEESSKIGTAGGTLTGAATGAAAGSVAGPIGTVVGGVAGAVAGAGLGAGADAAAKGVQDTGFENHDNDFRNHYNTNWTNSGYTYDQYSPVYRYGYNLANDDTYRGREWDDIEMDARRRWEDRNPGTWEQFKDSVRYAWDRARSKV